MTAPQVSVAMPTRNRWPMLEQALRSALGQEAVELEVIVVDEASSDGTPERLDRIGDERVSFLRHDTPRGPAAARNAAIERARGEWIAFLDDDDLWAPGKLRTQLARAAAGGHGCLHGQDRGRRPLGGAPDEAGGRPEGPGREAARQQRDRRPLERDAQAGPAGADRRIR